MLRFSGFLLVLKSSAKQRKTEQDWTDWKNIILREDILTSAKKTDVLVEEIAHSELTVGNILDQTAPNNRRQERKARLRAAEMQVPL